MTEEKNLNQEANLSETEQTQEQIEMQAEKKNEETQVETKEETLTNSSKETQNEVATQTETIVKKTEQSKQELLQFKTPEPFDWKSLESEKKEIEETPERKSLENIYENTLHLITDSK